MKEYEVLNTHTKAMDGMVDNAKDTIKAKRVLTNKHNRSNIEFVSYKNKNAS